MKQFAQRPNPADNGEAHRERARRSRRTLLRYPDRSGPSCGSRRANRARRAGRRLRHRHRRQCGAASSSRAREIVSKRRASASRRLSCAPGEASKSLGVFAEVCEQAIAAKLERGDLIVALGGGVVGDLAGFAAASLRRGMRFVQIPTTLLAQVEFLRRRQDRHQLAAWQESDRRLSSALARARRRRRAGDPAAARISRRLCRSRQIWAYRRRRLLRLARSQLARGVPGGPARIHAIATSCAAKAAIVGRDETEQGDRALLNLGHTFGHALRAARRIMTARGSCMAKASPSAWLRRSASRRGSGFAPPRMRPASRRHLGEVGLPTRIGDIAGLERRRRRDRRRPCIRTRKSSAAR